MKTSSKFRSLLSLSALVAASVAVAAPSYQVIQIGNLAGYEDGRAMAINNHNVVTGTSYSGSTNRPWLFSETDGMTPLGFDFGQEFFAYDIADTNLVAGYSEGWQHGVRLKPGQAIGWGDLPGYDQTSARGINNLGAMVGAAWIQDTARALRLNANFTYTLLPTLNVNEDSSAVRVNDAGVAVGHSSGNAVFWTAANTLINLHALLPNGTVFSSAQDINEAGWITGHFHDANLKFRGFRFNLETGMTFFNPLDNDTYVNASAINIHGQIVGRSRRNPYVGLMEAFIYDGTSTVSLNSLIDPNSGWVLNEATDINDNGYIVGKGTFQGVTTNFMLKPVPEPTTLIALGLGATTLLRRRHR